MTKYCEATITKCKKNILIAELDNGSSVSIKNKFSKKALYNDRVLLKNKNGHGYVQKILKRNDNLIVGIVENNGQYNTIKPWSTEYNINFFFEDDNISIGDAVQFTFEEWLSGKFLPKAKIKKVINKLDSNQELLYKFDLPKNFNDEICDDVNKIDFSINKDNRIDLTSLDTFSISDKYNQSAFSIEKTFFGYRIYVHISDVSSFIKVGTSYDKEAYHRAVSVELPKLSIPLLHNKIIDNTSLDKDINRHAISTVYSIDSDMNIFEYHTIKSIISNKKTFTVNEANEALKNSKNLFYSDLNLLNIISEKVYNSEFKQRLKDKKKYLSWNLNDDFKPTSVSLKEETLSEKIVDNWMCITNKYIIDKIEEFSVPFIYRTNKEIDKNNFIRFKKEFEMSGYKYNTDLSIYDNIDSITNSENKEIIKELLSEKMHDSKYDSKRHKHFLYGLKCYTHITSPMTRYADIINQRILTNVLYNKPISDINLDSVCKYLNKRDKYIKLVEEKTNQLLFDKLTEDINYSFDGNIIKFSKFGIVVKTDLLFEGIVPKSSFSAKWSKDENRWLNNENWKIGDKLKLKLCKDIKAEKIQLLIV